MLKPMEFIADIKQGKLVPPDHIASFLRYKDNQQASIKLSWDTKKRTQKQNSFYFGYVVPVVRQWLLERGYNFDATETHEFIVRYIWKSTEIIMIEGVPYEKRLSSTKHSPKKWEENIELVRIYGAEHGFYVPYPNEQQWSGSC